MIRVQCTFMSKYLKEISKTQLPIVIDFLSLKKINWNKKKKKQTHLQTFSIRWKKWALKLKKNHQSEKSDNVLEEGFV